MIVLTGGHGNTIALAGPGGRSWDPWTRGGGSGKTAQRPNAGETVDRCCQQCKLERGVASEPPACGRRRRR